MSVHNLAATFDDKERVPKIQGLINHLMTFMTKEMARITGAYENVVTMDEVIDKRLILYLSLNTNINKTAITSLGRILLQNLQLMIGRRYSKSSYGTVHPFVSVIMDEFAPFAYQEFAQIINQARGTNVAFLFALQNQSQLLQVGESFRSDLSSSPNTTFMLRSQGRPDGEDVPRRLFPCKGDEEVGAICHQRPLCSQIRGTKCRYSDRGLRHSGQR